MAEPRVFYVHLMKTGGTSFGRWMRQRFPAARTYPDVESGEGPQAKVMARALLDAPAERRASIDFFSVHMAAWVGEAVAPDHLLMTVLRDPVDRTISHLRHIARLPETPDGLEDIYRDPRWRDRLRDYQVQLLSQEQHHHEAAMNEARAWALDPTAMDQTQRSELEDGLRTQFATAVLRPRPLIDADLRRAKERVAGMAEVGVTEQLDALAARVSRRFGWHTALPPHRNAAPGAQTSEVSPKLLADVEQDTVLDRELYEFARDLGTSGTRE